MAGLPVWYERVEDTMRISGNEVKKVVGRKALVEEIQKMDLPMEASPRPEDAALIKRVTHSVVEMEDRDEVVAELKAQIEAGTYNPTGDEIADAMIRRAIADRTK